MVRLTTNREKPPDFIFEQWQRALVDRPSTSRRRYFRRISQLPKISKSDTHRRLSSDEQTAVRKAMDAALDNARQGGFLLCQKRAWCVAMLDNGDILVTIENAAYLGPACDTADIVVTPCGCVLIAADPGQCFSQAKRYAGPAPSKCDLRTDEPEITTTAFQNSDTSMEPHRAYDWRNGHVRSADRVSVTGQ